MESEMNLKNPFLSALLSAFLLIFALPGFAKENPIYTAIFSKLAVGGYDVVTYFTPGQPGKGDAKHTTLYKGAEWRFVSEENKARFISNPEQYAPQYGGYCSWAISQGYTASGDPTKWKIVDGKLYLNYDSDVQKKWEADIPGFISKANRQWPSVLDK
jgi:YHS domain-containing protein